MHEVFVYSSVSVSPSMWAKLECRLGMHVGNCTALNMVFNQTARCHLTKPGGVVMTVSTHSSVRLVQENTCQGLFLWIWNPQ